MDYQLKVVMLECNIMRLFDKQGKYAERELAAWREHLAEKGIQLIVRAREKYGLAKEKDDFWDILPPNGELLITDDESRARQRSKKHGAVMGLLHSGNQGTSFEGVKYLGIDPTQMDTEDLERIYRRCMGIPWRILETKDCYLRETTVEDVDEFYEIYRDPSVTAYMEDLFEDRDKEIAYTQDYIRNVYEYYGFGVWTVCQRGTGRVIGRAGISYREGFLQPELGFVIGVPWQGHGLAGQVCEAITRFAKTKLGFSELIAFADLENKPSIRLLEKLKFVEQDPSPIPGSKVHKFFLAL